MSRGIFPPVQGPPGPAGAVSLYAAPPAATQLVGYVGQMMILEGESTGSQSGLTGLVPNGRIVGSMDYDDSPQGLVLRCSTPGTLSASIETAAVSDIIVTFVYYVPA